MISRTELINLVLDKSYLVGGAVRDKLLGRQAHDRDYVVVGLDEEIMLGANFRPVGKHFPVYLHPVSNNEYAMARREKKTGDKHTDFEFEFGPEVTLEEDLRRRDFTVNAMALDRNGTVIAPHGGLQDLENHYLRPVDAEHFIEDPLRVLRAARFLAQLPDFKPTLDLMQLCTKMANEGMLEHLTPERVWKETEKALMTKDSAIYFEFLEGVGALEHIYPEIDNLTNCVENHEYHPEGDTFTHTMLTLEKAQTREPLVNFAMVMHDIGKQKIPEEIRPKYPGHEQASSEIIKEFCQKYKVPNQYRDFAVNVAKNHMRFKQYGAMKLVKRMKLVQSLSSGFTNYDELDQYLRCFLYDDLGRGIFMKDKVLSVCANMQDAKSIYRILECVGMEDFDIKIQQDIKRRKGKFIGEAYDEALLGYLKRRYTDISVRER